jgi:hypothetical protein
VARHKDHRLAAEPAEAEFVRGPAKWARHSPRQARRSRKARCRR